MDQDRPHTCSPGSPTNASSFQCSQGWGFAEQSLPGLTNNSALESAGSVCFQSQTSEGDVPGWPAFFYFLLFHANLSLTFSSPKVSTAATTCTPKAASWAIQTQATRFKTQPAFLTSPPIGWRLRDVTTTDVSAERSSETWETRLAPRDGGWTRARRLGNA